MSGDTSKQNTNKQTETPSRDNIRAAIFGAKPDMEEVEFFGNKIELRQPTMGILLEMRKMGEADQLTQMLVQYAFVPGTDEHVFEPEDEESIKQIPFGPDMTRLQDGINKLIGLEGLDKQVQNAMKTAQNGPAKANDDVGGSGVGEES